MKNANCVIKDYLPTKTQIPFIIVLVKDFATYQIGKVKNKKK